MTQANTYTADIIDALLDAVHRFCKNHVTPATERPETVASPQIVAEIIEAAYALGIVGDPEVGLWPDLLDSHSTALTLKLLERIGESNAGIAVCLHRLALGRWLARRLDVSATRAAAVLEGRWALSGAALARWLRGCEESEGDHPLLGDQLVGATVGPEMVFLAPPATDYLLFPCMHDRLGWAAIPTTDLDLQAEASVHGLNETPCWRLRGASAVTPLSTTPSQARELYLSALTIELLGSSAIAVGTTRAACRQSTEYALSRRQGGKTICGHDAIRELVGRCWSNLTAANRLIAPLTSPFGSADALIEGARLTAVAQPLLREALTSSLQVFGGMGYMQDLGQEKRLRDANQLLLAVITPDELRQFSAEVEFRR